MSRNWVLASSRRAAARRSASISISVMRPSACARAAASSPTWPCSRACFALQRQHRGWPAPAPCRAAPAGRRVPRRSAPSCVRQRRACASMPSIWLADLRRAVRQACSVCCTASRAAPQTAAAGLRAVRRPRGGLRPRAQTRRKGRWPRHRRARPPAGRGARGFEQLALDNRQFRPQQRAVEPQQQIARRTRAPSTTMDRGHHAAVGVLHDLAVLFHLDAARRHYRPRDRAGTGSSRQSRPTSTSRVSKPDQHVAARRPGARSGRALIAHLRGRGRARFRHGS